MRFSESYSFPSLSISGGSKFLRGKKIPDFSLKYTQGVIDITETTKSHYSLYLNIDSGVPKFKEQQSACTGSERWAHVQ